MCCFSAFYKAPIRASRRGAGQRTLVAQPNFSKIQMMRAETST